MNIIVTDCGSYSRVILDGRVDANTSPQLQQAILNTLQKDRNIVLDFLNVPYISSAGLRALLIGHKTAASKGGSMKLTNLSDTVNEVLVMSGFASILTII